MFNMHAKLNEYYEDHVRLGKERLTLASYRDKNLERLRSGLEKLGCPSSFDYRNQGSYAMHTINQHPRKEYDIDVAVIFCSDDLPSRALQARKRVEAAMREGGGNFSQPPEAKTNAVRVYYSEGYHIDLAIYRLSGDGYGSQICEHAGSEWTLRDPVEITNWFNEMVRKLSPTRDQGATVAANQMRRVVRWSKAFAKSRENWDLPGGLIVSVLVAECYRPNPFRDDVCLYETMASIRDRLRDNEDVANPVDGVQLLTDRPVDIGRVRRLKESLDSAILGLQVLHDPACREEQAMDAWHWVFQHPFWAVDIACESTREYGQLLGAAARVGETFVTTTGRVSAKKPAEQHVRAPVQRFYGS